MFAVGTDEVVAPEKTRSVSTAGISVSSVSTVAPHVSPWLQPAGPAYRSSTRSVMSRPGSSSVLTMPRCGWCRSMMYEPAG